MWAAGLDLRLKMQTNSWLLLSPSTGGNRKRDIERKLIERDSNLQQSGLSDMLFSYFHPDKNILPVSSSYPSPIHLPIPTRPQTCTPTHVLVLLCVFVYTVNTQTHQISHVLFTPVILLHTAMETEFAIQISLLSGGMCMSVRELKLFRWASFFSSRGSLSFNQSLCSNYFH